MPRRPPGHEHLERLLDLAGGVVLDAGRGAQRDPGAEQMRRAVLAGAGTAGEDQADLLEGGAGEPGARAGGARGLGEG